MAIKRLKAHHIATWLKSKQEISDLVSWEILSKEYKKEKNITWNFILIRVLSDERINQTCRRARVEMRTTWCDCDVSPKSLEDIADIIDDCIQSTCDKVWFRTWDIYVDIAEQIDVFTDRTTKNIPLVLSQFYLYYIA